MFEADPLQEDRIRKIREGLESLGELQEYMLRKLEFHDTTTETLSRYGLALIIELAEFLNETPWKKWKRKSTAPANKDRMMEEFADFLSFLGAWVGFMGLMGMSAEDISRAYQRKLRENNERFGVTRAKN